MNRHHTPHRFRALSILLALFVVTAQVVLIPQTASAAQITNRSLTLQAGATDGGSKPGGVVYHLFSFRLPGGSTVGSIRFQYCTTAADVGAATCVTPTGLLTTSATLGTETGVTGFTLNNTTNGAPYLSRAPAAIGTNVDATYQLRSVTNPSYGPTVPDTNKTFFVRITTYATNNATGSVTDLGTVAASTAEPIIISGVMPESLVFCTGATISTTSGVPDCLTATSGVIAFNQLFSPTDTATTSSQMAASTNAGFGYTISVNGPTLTSGTNTITGMSAAGLGVRGTSQFGMNLKANTVLTSTTPVGIEVAPTASVSGTGPYRGQAAAGYDVVDNFKFVTGDTVAKSDYTSAGASDAQIYTVTYIANVPGSQAAGTYTTTLTYICTATF